MTFRAILAVAAAMSFAAFSAHAQLPGGQVGGELTDSTAGAAGPIAAQVIGQVQADTKINSRLAISTTRGAVRDTTPRSRIVTEAAGKHRRAIGQVSRSTTKGVVSRQLPELAVGGTAAVSGPVKTDAQ